MNNPHQPIFPCDALPADPAYGRLLGLYPQLQEGLWMQRIKVLGGALSAGQWRALSQVARRHAPRAPLHLTTRQDLELHGIPAVEVPHVQRDLAAAGLSGLGACGDTLRNITVCPCSGLTGIDLDPLAWHIRRELEAFEDIYSLPRKFKIGLSCGAECGQPFINDLAFVAADAGTGAGFRVIGAGSLGARPATGVEIRPWVAPREVVPIALAAVRLFNRLGDRANRRAARLRHLRQRLGDEAFLAALNEEISGVTAERDWADVDVARPQAPLGKPLWLTFANGDVWPQAAEALADLLDTHQLAVRIAVHHRIGVFGAAIEELAAVNEYPAVREAARPQPTVIACPGRRWCSRALVETNAFADTLRRELADVLPPGAVVGISGCPNGCAQNAVADAGLSGCLGTRDGQRMELFTLAVGGEGGRGPRLAESSGEKLTPQEAIGAIRAWYLQQRTSQ